MKKSTFMKLMLMLLPLGALGLATTNNSVMMLDTLTGTASYCSYFDLAETGALQMAAPTAALLTLTSGILTAVYLGKKKQGLLKAVAVTAFLAATVATLPVLIQSQVKVVPNVMLPIMMMAEAVLANLMERAPQEKGNTYAPRLNRR